MARLEELTRAVVNRTNLAEGLTVLFFPASIALFKPSGVPRDRLFIEAANGIMRLTLFFLPVIIFKLAFGLTGIKATHQHVIHSFSKG